MCVNRKIYLMPSNEWKQIKKAGSQMGTYISAQKGTYETKETDKISPSISVQKGTTIYILGDTQQTEREVSNG